MPRAIKFPAGSGRKAPQKDMDDLVAHLRGDPRLILESDEFKKESEEVINTYRKQKEIIREFNDRLLKENFQLVQFQMGPFTRQDVAPIVEGALFPSSRSRPWPRKTSSARRSSRPSGRRSSTCASSSIRSCGKPGRSQRDPAADHDPRAQVRLPRRDGADLGPEASLRGLQREGQRLPRRSPGIYLVPIWKSSRKRKRTSSNRPCRFPCPRRP